MPKTKDEYMIQSIFAKFRINPSITILLIAAAVMGSIIGLISGAFMQAQHYLIELIWHILPDAINIQSTIIFAVICLAGGVLVGLGQKFLGDHPKPMHSVMDDIKAGKANLPLSTVPKAFLISVISLGFGAALGPEAALVGICVSLGMFTGEVIENLLSRRSDDPKSQKQIKIVLYLTAFLFGIAVFFVMSANLFEMNYVWPEYHIPKDGSDLLITIPLSIVGFVLGKIASGFEGKLADFLHNFKDKPVLKGAFGGLVLGLLSIVSPLVLFSGQAGLGSLLEEGAQLGGWMLLGIGAMKLIALKANIVSGWKGGEIFPAIFAGAAFGLGISMLIPAIHPMVAAAAVVTGLTITFLGNIPIVIVTVLIFLPLNLIVPIITAGLTVFLLQKASEIIKGYQARFQPVPIKIKED